MKVPVPMIPSGGVGAMVAAVILIGVAIYAAHKGTASETSPKPY